MRARIAAIVSVAAVAALMTPAHAAKSVTLYFDNTGGCGTGSPAPSLVTGGPAGSECNSVRLGAQGTGSLGKDDYVNAGKKTVGYKIDAGRKIVGNVNLICTGVVSTTGFIPGYVGAKVTVTINGVTVGTASGEGAITAPDGHYTVPLNMTIPKSLNGKVAKSIDALVAYTAGTGICGVGYTAPHTSSFNIPSK